ncbi:multiple epidermal growth factor-like domains protein 6 [Colias croceus]|uniref:multiple epidermal growth factor-like domains protein 6 n=1 Tax=Colias crocea TaxID=72248 RepID=UPI001E27FFCB|nr:multiple epidermal growth factor-like domains protein 6 [Colias croceus]
MYGKIVIIVALVHAASALWQCTNDSDCSSRNGSICVEGTCKCPTGREPGRGGMDCIRVAPYYSSPCVDTTQCSRLFSNYECRQVTNSTISICACLPGTHYFLGRCWNTKSFGESCTRDEECLSTPRDPFSLKCDGVCVCSDGYYERQRGECRKIGKAVGDGCVVDSDCQFTGGACNINTFSCVDSTVPQSKVLERIEQHTLDVEHSMTDRTVQAVHDTACNASAACPSPQLCVDRTCVCPVGFYMSDDKCYAELGTPSTPEQCGGLLATVIDGVCACPPNFFYNVNMRDCIKVTRRITDSCVIDANCHTFGAESRCGAPREPWGFRTCECITENAVWDSSRNMCRLFAGVGETCSIDSDCMAGEVEINCVLNDEGVGYCRCPAHLTEINGLCLNMGLELGDSCQSNLECTGTANTACVSGKCDCAEGFQLEGEQCAPVIGGPCTYDTDCVIDNTICKDNNGVSTCQCDQQYVAYDQQCWTISPGFNSSCTITEQCRASMGDAGTCVDGSCMCSSGYHFRDGQCWQITGLFQTCSRSSQCYLQGMSDVVVCRNGRCQCDFDHPYSDELQTCTSSASSISASIFVIAAAVFTFIRN